LDIHQEYGVPIATSSNGQLFIFQKSLEQIEQMKSLSPEQMIEEYSTIHIFKLSIFRF
jgi:hypothetical protein